MQALERIAVRILALCGILWLLGAVDSGVLYDSSTKGMTAYAKTSITLGAGATTFSASGYNYVILTCDAGANTIATITGGVQGQVLTIQFADALCTVSDNNAFDANSVDLNGSQVSTARDIMYLISDGTSWHKIAYSGN